MVFVRNKDLLRSARQLEVDLGEVTRAIETVMDATSSDADFSKAVGKLSLRLPGLIEKFGALRGPLAVQQVLLKR